MKETEKVFKNVDDIKIMRNVTLPFSPLLFRLSLAFSLSFFFVFPPRISNPVGNLEQRVLQNIIKKNAAKRIKFLLYEG